MAILSDISQSAQDKLEQPAADALKFWDPTYEILSFLVEGMNEALLITGEPEVKNATPFTVAANVNLQSMPTNAVAITRVEGPNGAIKKCTVYDLDQFYPAWENDTGTDIKFWFPVGLTQWGVYPKLTATVQVQVSQMSIPIPASLPYTGNETIPFQQEYLEGFTEYAAHAAKVKEGGSELYEGMHNLDTFLNLMEQLSRFSFRKGELRFSVARGVPARVNPVTVR